MFIIVKNLPGGGGQMVLSEPLGDGPFPLPPGSALVLLLAPVSNWRPRNGNLAADYESKSAKN